MVFNVVVHQTLLVIHLRDAFYHLNVVIHIVNAMKQEYFVQMLVRKQLTAHAVKFAIEVDVVQNVVQVDVHQDNYAKMVHALQDVEQIVTVEMIDHALMDNVLIHVQEIKHVVKMQFVKLLIIEFYAYVLMDIKVNQRKNVYFTNVKQMMIAI